MKFTTTDKVALSHGVKVLCYARAGAGKTTMCKTALTPVIISAEAGLLSLRDVSIPTILVESMADLTEIYNWCKGSKEAQGFETKCIDSLSEIAETVLGTEKAATKDGRKAYGDMADKMMALVRAYRDLPGHVYFSAKSAYDKDEVTGISRYGPSMPGRQLGPQLPYFFDEVFSLEVGKDQQGADFRYLRTRLDLQYEAKDRSGALDQFEPPDLSHVVNKILRGAAPA
jgi:hypothetical protein